MERALVIDHSTLIIRRAAAVVLGALLVAGAAQVAVPLPGTPVPMTLQPMAVLLVGGLLGARLGALSMILYLAMGAAGLPVFADRAAARRRAAAGTDGRVFAGVSGGGMGGWGSADPGPAARGEPTGRGPGDP